MPDVFTVMRFVNVTSRLFPSLSRGNRVSNVNQMNFQDGSKAWLSESPGMRRIRVSGANGNQERSPFQPGGKGGEIDPRTASDDLEGKSFLFLGKKGTLKFLKSEAAAFQSMDFKLLLTFVRTEVRNGDTVEVTAEASVDFKNNTELLPGSEDRKKFLVKDVENCLLIFDKDKIFADGNKPDDVRSMKLQIGNETIDFDVQFLDGDIEKKLKGDLTEVFADFLQILEGVVADTRWFIEEDFREENGLFGEFEEDNLMHWIKENMGYADLGVLPDELKAQELPKHRVKQATSLRVEPEGGKVILRFNDDGQDIVDLVAHEPNPQKPGWSQVGFGSKFGWVLTQHLEAV
ncbi:MAG: hypothetical protein H6559_08995 [Lewinellaceae bacterium]|nr:hypothetical protein [Lewinellaceae bacterium]